MTTKKEILEKLGKADQVVTDLCSGKFKWDMQVPARPDHDPDLVISAALTAAGQYITETAAARTIHIHKVKCWPEHFTLTCQLKKTAELRKNDRDYQVGDILILEEWHPGPPDTNAYTGRTTVRTITHVLEGTRFGLYPDYCMLSLARLPSTLVTIIMDNQQLKFKIKEPGNQK